VFICCPDPGRREMCVTLREYLTRAGFRVFFEPASELPAPDRLALAGTVSDFVLFLPPAGFDLAGGGGEWQAQVAAALETGRNVVRVSLADEPAWTAEADRADLAGLVTRQALTYDPDRLAESLSLIQHCLSTDTIVNDRHLSRRWKRLFMFAAALILVGFSAQTIPILIKAWKRPRQLPPVAPFVLYWSGFAERDVAGIAEELPLVSGMAIKPGDRLRVAFSPSADGFAYVVTRDTRGRVSVLFPGESIKGASRVKAGQSYGAPLQDGWLMVEADAGLDTLYVFGSYDSLQNLEELVEEPETPTNLGGRRELLEQTVNGLLDGRHYPPGPRIWIRTTALVDQSLKSPAGPRSFSAVFRNGKTVTHPAAIQPGLVNALAEIKVAFSR
jgi:hypothetical protein